MSAEITSLCAVERPADVLRRLEAEAKDVAKAEVGRLLTELNILAHRCHDLKDVSSIPAGIRHTLERLSDRINEDIRGITALQGRSLK